MTPAEAKQLWEDVKAAHAKERACRGHRFVDTTPEKVVDKRWRCTGCGFELRPPEHYWYERGRRDAIPRTPKTVTVQIGGASVIAMCVSDPLGVWIWSGNAWDHNDIGNARCTYVRESAYNIGRREDFGPPEEAKSP